MRERERGPLGGREGGRERERGRGREDQEGGVRKDF